MGWKGEGVEGRRGESRRKKGRKEEEGRVDSEVSKREKERKEGRARLKSN